MTKKRASRLEWARLSRDLSGLLQLGYPLAEAVERILPAQSKLVSEQLQGSLQTLREGSTLSQAIGSETGVDPIFLRLVQATEERDSLPESLESAASLMELLSERRTLSYLALLYPTIVITLVLFLFWLVVTAGGSLLSKLFYSLGVELPLATRLLILLSEFFSGPLGLVVVAAPIAFIWYFLLSKSRVSALRFNIPLVGTWLKRQEAYIYLNCLAELLEAGSSVGEASKLAVTACHPSLQDKLASISEKVESGDTLSQALGGQHLLPEIAHWALEQTEASGEFDLEKVASLVDRELQFSQGTGLAVFEPIAFLGVAAVIGFFVVAVFLPLYQLIGNLG